MSIETNKTNLEAGSFKALKNVADVARQVMLGEEQEKLEIQELVNRISATSYLDETQKAAIIEIFGLSQKEKQAKADKERADDTEARAAQQRRNKRSDERIAQEKKDKAAAAARRKKQGYAQGGFAKGK